MVNRAKQRGTAWETRLVAYFREHGFPHCERRATSGANDKGDLVVPGVVIEAKNQKAIDLARWVDEMVVEKRNAGVSQGAVIFPRRNHATARAYVVLELADYLELIK